MILLIFYLLLFSVFLTCVFTWTLERRWKKYLLGETYSGHTFIWSSCIFIFSYMGNMVVYFMFHGAFVHLQLSLLAAACIFIMIKEKGFKAEADQALLRISREIADLKEALKADPSNAACHERISELLEKLGAAAAAAAHAKAAAGLDPTEKNKWRLETLRRDIEEKGSAGGKS